MDKNIQEALKWIYASLGGDISALANVNDVTAILNAIADLDTVQKIKSATELPDVSDADDGDVLTVVDGEWAKAEPSGGGSSLPSVSSTDNGDVLTVVDGAWDKAASTGLPAVTSADNGKGLSVQGTPVAGAVIVPEQTASYDEDNSWYPLSNFNLSLFTEGVTVLLTIGEQSEVCTVMTDGQNAWVSFSDGSAGIEYSGGLAGAWIETADPPATLTVSCALATFNYGWAVTPQSLLVPVLWDNDNSRNEAQMTAGEIAAAIAAGKSVVFYEDAGVNGVSYAPVVRAYAREDGGYYAFTVYLSSDWGQSFQASSATDKPVYEEQS